MHSKVLSHDIFLKEMKKILSPPTPMSSLLPTFWGGISTTAKPAYHPVYNPAPPSMATTEPRFNTDT